MTSKLVLVRVYYSTRERVIEPTFSANPKPSLGRRGPGWSIKKRGKKKSPSVSPKKMGERFCLSVSPLPPFYSERRVSN